MCLVEKQREMAKKKKPDSLLFLIFISDSGTKRPLFFQLLQSCTGAGCGGCGGSALRLARHRQVLPSCPSCPSAAIASSALEPSASGTAASSRRAGAARPAPGQTARRGGPGPEAPGGLLLAWGAQPSERLLLPGAQLAPLLPCSKPPRVLQPAPAGQALHRWRDKVKGESPTGSLRS